MIKIIAPRAVLLALGVSCLCAIGASAQSTNAKSAVTQVTPGAVAPAAAPAAPIGPAPANSHQDKVLSGALSPQTRQTLQEAMNAFFDDEKPHHAPAK